MKKTSYVFVVLISFFVFFIQFRSYSMNERKEIISIYQNIADKENLTYQIVTLQIKENTEKTLDKVKEFSEKNKVIVMTGRTANKDAIKVAQEFVHMPEGLTFDYFSTIHGKKLPTDQESGYLTTVLNDPDSYDQIDFVDPENHKPYKLYSEIYPLSKYQIEDKNQFEMNIIVIVKNKEVLVQMLKESPLADDIENLDQDVFQIPDRSEKDHTMDVNISLLSICCISLLLLYLCQIVKNRKEVMICKMMGYTNSQITQRIFLKQMIMSILLFLFVQAICYVFFVGQCRPVTYPFIMILAIYIMVFILSIALIYLVMLITVITLKEVTSMKRKSRFHMFGIMSLGLKTIMLILIIPPLLSITKDGLVYGIEGYHLLSLKDEIIDKIYIRSFDSRYDKNYDILKAYHILNQNGAIYQDYSAYQMQEKAMEEMNQESHVNPYIVVNKNYLRAYDLYEKNGKKIDIDSIQKTTMFLPEGTTIYAAGDYVQEDCDIMEIKKGNQYSISDIQNLNLMKLRDPIVILDTGTPSGGIYYLSKEKKAEVLRDLDQEGMKNTIFFTNTTDLYQYRFEEVKSKLISFMVIFVLYILVLFIILYQNLYLYFVDKKKHIAIMYSYGDHWLYRHGDLLYHNLIMYVPVILYLYFIASISIYNILICILLTMLIEIVLTYDLIHHYEIHHTTNILKGEE